MANPSSESGLRAKLKKERRTNRRLRALIDDFQVQVRSVRSDLDVQFRRIAQLQAELDDIKKTISTKTR